jgi:hypothetical protein
MKTININMHRRLRFAAAILTAGYFTAAGSVQAGDDVPFKLNGTVGIIQSVNITSGVNDPLCGDFDPADFEGLTVIDNLYGGECDTAGEAFVLWMPEVHRRF